MRVSQALQDRLQNTRLGYQVELLETVGSTNDQLKAQAEAGAPEGAAVWALAQTKGRGQFERQWVSAAEKGVYLSVLVRPDWPVQEVGLLSPITAVSVVTCLERLGVRDVRIKMPNDILVAGRKIAGLLIEPRVSDTIDFVVIGIGLNVRQVAEDWAGTDLEEAATSVLQQGVDVSLDDAVAGLLLSFDEWYNGDRYSEKLKACWQQHGGEPF
jgi:BirA family biotin operon repressor/biotin-[acetyl-CoA-carboxylase] ligase